MAQTKLRIHPDDARFFTEAADINDVKHKPAIRYDDQTIIVPVNFRSPEQLFNLGKDMVKFSSKPEVLEAVEETTAKAKPVQTKKKK